MAQGSRSAEGWTGLRPGLEDRPAARSAAGSSGRAPALVDDDDTLRRERRGDVLRALFYRSQLYRRWALGGAVPSAVRFAFPSHAGADPAQAEAILAQRFLFHGRSVPFGQLPWSVEPHGPRLARALHGFGWLIDLQAAGSEEAQRRGRELVVHWIAAHRRWSPLAWSPEVQGERLCSWLAAGDFILAGASPDERVRFLESAAGQARHLARTRPVGGGAEAFTILAGEIAAALCLGAVPLDPPLRQLTRQIDRQILADGCHWQRAPERQLAVLRRLVAIARALRLAELAVPPSLQGAIERVAPMLRAMRHGCGGLALFHGGKEGDRTLIDQVLAASGVGTPAVDSSPATGWERLAAGRLLVLADFGAPPPRGHAGLLAIEASDGRERLIVNCGGYGGDDARWQAALASTAAHSTVCVEEASAYPAGRRGVHASLSRQEADGAVWLEGAHDGYRRAFGITHRRRLYLAASGDDLRGEDVLEGRRGRRFHVRFHLHPKVSPQPLGEGQGIRLTTGSGRVWRFLAVGGAVTLDESTYLGVSDQPLRTRQIVVTGVTDKTGAQVKWALRREGNPLDAQPSRAPDDAAPPKAGPPKAGPPKADPPRTGPAGASDGEDGATP